jgi:hypothetical protein
LNGFERWWKVQEISGWIPPELPAFLMFLVVFDMVFGVGKWLFFGRGKWLFCTWSGGSERKYFRPLLLPCPSLLYRRLKTKVSLKMK